MHSVGRIGHWIDAQCTIMAFQCVKLDRNRVAHHPALSGFTRHVE